MSNKRNLLLLFERKLEPVFMEKGPNNAVFDVPEKLLSDRYKGKSGVTQRFGDPGAERIPVKNVPLPNLSGIETLGRNENFSLFIPRHRDLAAQLVHIFMGLRNVDELLSVAVYARDRVNPVLFNYSLSVAIFHRADTKDLSLPTMVETFPEKFVDSQVFGSIREEADVVRDEQQRIPIIIPRDYTASDREPEHRLWYFREDIGLNLHHWHWHLVFPTDAVDINIVRKNRRGELFYYMHQQIIARYNFERLCNDLGRVERFNNVREPIKEAYFPKMDSLVASRAWPARQANTTLKDLNRELDQIKYDVADIERWTKRFVDACHQGFVIDENGGRIRLDETSGIDRLGDIMESSRLSSNRDFYGNLHGMGHVFISHAHDPDHRNLESFGVMGDSTTAMRDPLFYRWHAYIDDLFQEHKQRLPAYTNQQLGYPGVRVTGVQVQPTQGPPNTFQTYWQQSDVNLSRGLDFVPRGTILARFTHLQHNAFSYNISINNTTGAQAMGTCRIFMAPHNDERGTPFQFRDQRHMMCEMDRFIVGLNPGNNLIRRESTDSSVTIPFERTFRDVDTNRPADGTPESEQFNLCGCGWPQHLLIPKGEQGRGTLCDLFVMISNYADDRIDQDLVGQCNDASSYCGVRDRLYPDRRPMGFPFDRNARAGVSTLQQFLSPNMMSISCSIVHQNRTMQPQRSN